MTDRLHMITHDKLGQIHAWVNQQLHLWERKFINQAELAEKYNVLNCSRESIFLFRFSHKTVTISPKPKASPAGDPMDRYKPYSRRALYYRDFLEFVARQYNVDGSFQLAIDVEDQPPAECEHMPIFVFQKLLGTKGVLLPDIDFLYEHFYADNKYCDRLDYDRKQVSAAFAGATTGGGKISLTAVRSRTVPRLRAGTFFRDCPDVDFRIPRIVQCENADVVEEIRSLMIPSTAMTWQEQFCHKFLLSLDGNGATCSRVAVTLRSESVLLKYESLHVLFYFSSLIPWLHYIPVENDKQVLEVIESEKETPGRFSYIAKSGKNFATTFLNRESICEYTAVLLKRFRNLVNSLEFSEHEQFDNEEERQNKPPALSVMVDVNTKGELWGWSGMWVGNPGSGLKLRSFLIEMWGGTASGDIEYNSYYSTEIHSAWVTNGGRCGPVGSEAHIVGLAIRLKEPVSATWNIIYKCAFTDGSTSQFVRNGEPSLAPGGSSYVEAIFIKFMSRLESL